MKRLRMWFYSSFANLLAIGVRWARGRAARICGCDACRLVFDVKYRNDTLNAEVQRMFGGTVAAPPDRRPS